jgi:hypothetical protein
MLTETRTKNGAALQKNLKRRLFCKHAYYQGQIDKKCHKGFRVAAGTPYPGITGLL